MKLNYLVIIIILMFFSGMFIYCFNMKHLLLTLLSLEFIILSLFFMLYLYLLMYSLETYLMLYFLIMSVSESVLGLSLLVGVIRSNGNDYFQSFNMINV